MEFDLVLVSLPAYTQKCPSLHLASLASYLNSRQYEVICYDYGIQFYQKELEKFTIVSPLVNQLSLSLYPLWGASNWLGFNDIISQKNGQFLIKSLCPVCSNLYEPIFNEFNDQIALTKKTLDSHAEELANLDTLAYGFSLLLGNAIASLYVIKRLKQKKPEAIIIVGGPEASPHYRALLYAHVDDIDFTVYHAEGEIPLERIISYLKGIIPKEAIPGIYFKTQDGIHKTAPPALLDLNQLPIPNFELVENGNSLHQLKSIDMLTSKGCIYNCTFCNEPLIWGSYRSKSVKKIFDEIKYYRESLGISRIDFSDNSFSSSPSLVKALERLFKEGFHVNWGGNCRLNELNPKKLLLFRKLGLTDCDIGIESASPKVLQLMDKNIDISRAGMFLEICSKNQIKPSLYFMVGFPGETSQEFQKTTKFIELNISHIHNIVVSVFTLMSGVPIFHSELLKPIQLGPKSINAYTYQTTDGVTHKDRKARFLKIHKYKALLKQ
ncbi:MAG: B12-binding domain-containing radical SAM protein [Candidatus Helarchaeota archaeon]|nr:B12-binding domain-containing radical SAM protein [Candidatus Helarchaeota archaeon]